MADGELVTTRPCVAAAAPIVRRLAARACPGGLAEGAGHARQQAAPARGRHDSGQRQCAAAGGWGGRRCRTGGRGRRRRRADDEQDAALPGGRARGSGPAADARPVICVAAARTRTARTASNRPASRLRCRGSSRAARPLRRGARTGAGTRTARPPTRQMGVQPNASEPPTIPNSIPIKKPPRFVPVNDKMASSSPVMA